MTHTEPFGAFCDIGCGLISLLPVDAISVSRISSPADRLHNGMEIRAAVRTVDPESGRIYLSMRELLGTWEENTTLFTPGQTVAGVIRSVESYGIFIELTPNLAGLAEVRDRERDLASIGHIAAVYIKSINPERMKVKLALVDSYKGNVTVPPLHYYVPQSVHHLDRWVYSPASCARVVETVFDA
ncbi:rNA binding S1 domain protein [Clostridium sp. CAG:448]|nr:rNA binding S1 domain protein [Clostridium sp. CAG:448]